MPKRAKTSSGPVMHGSPVDVIVVGGGMVGLAFACALKDSGLHIVVIERGDAPLFESLGKDCRVSAIVLGNQRILEGLGAWKHLAADAQAMQRMTIWDGQNPGGISFDGLEIEAEALGYLVENSKLVAALRKTILAYDHIEVISPASVLSVTHEDACVRVHLDDGNIFEAPLLVGADGANSWVREQADIGIYTRDYTQKGIVATVRPRMPHRAVAYQRFTDSGPLAMLPMTDGLCSIVWSQFNDEADRLMALDDAGFLGDLNMTFGPVLGCIEEVARRAAFPLKARLAMHLVRPRLALIGDAAHTIHPLAGLGVNLGLRDAMVLAQEIVDAKKYEEDWGELDVLNRYMKQRLPDVLSVMGSMESFHRIFTTPIPGLNRLRGIGMKTLGNAGVIKRLLMQNSTGLNLPVPKQIS